MSCPHTYLKRPHAIIATFAIYPFLFVPQAWAAPHSINLVRRNGSSNASEIAAPIIASLVFFVAIPMVFYRKDILSMLRRVSLPSLPLRQRPSPATVRDLTAEEIAGTAATNQAEAASAARTNRRTGRNRRTPSQISTRSLPVYMKEPGELELVIIQGSQDMEDAPLTAQVVMPSVREDEDESANSHSRGPSQASYVIVNDDPLAQTPLLERNDSNENTHEHQNTHTSAGSVDISDARRTDHPNSAEIPDPRGEAPPYFEVVGDLADVGATSGDLSRVDTADTLPIAPDTLPTTDATTTEATSHPVRRRSMFRGLIDAASRALSSPHPTSPTLPLSRSSRDMAVSPPPRPSNLSNRQGGARSPLSGHRATPSHSGSVQSVTSSAFGRVISRTHSRSVTNVAAGLTSPSAISIASISAPLTHTALRTDFVYPRSGPTPEQLKLISSIESVSKFGVPYGPDAVAFASASLVNLHGPPPEFEEHPSTDGPSVSETRARAASALSRVSPDGNIPDSRISMSSLPSSLRESIVPSGSAAHESESSLSHPNPETRSPVSDHNNDDNASAPEPEPFEDKKEREVDSPITTIPPRIPSPSPTVGTVSTAVTVTKGTTAELGVVPESPEIAPLSSHRPALPSIASETAPATTPTRNAAAPSSFRMPSTPHGRLHPGSRSSSVETFRTAASKHGQGHESDHGASDTDHETDAFTDAESGAETEVDTRPVTPHAAPEPEFPGALSV